jgi:hypothetical protein
MLREAGADVVLNDLTEFTPWLHSMEALVAGREHHLPAETFDFDSKRN